MHNDLSGQRITAMPNLAEVSNLLFRCGNADILHHRILRLFLTIVPGGLPCEHPFLEAVSVSDGAEGDAVREQYHCLDCKCRVEDPEKVQREVDKRKRFLQQQQMRMYMQGQAATGAPIGVSIAWLVQWTREHNCWHMPTWLVRRLFVLPLTSQTHCCYADLPHMQQAQDDQQRQQQTFTSQQQQQPEQHQPQGGNDTKTLSASPNVVTMAMSPDDHGHSSAGPIIQHSVSASSSNSSSSHNSNNSNGEPDPTGPAHTFVCHKWSDTWGDLVRAVAEHSPEDWSLKLYIDLFCRSPYQTSSSASSAGHESESLATMRRCQAFLLVCPSLDEVTHSRGLTQQLSATQSDKLWSPQFWDAEKPQEALLSSSQRALNNEDQMMYHPDTL